MRINTGSSSLEASDPGKLPKPGTGTGTIDRSPDGGAASPNSTGKVASGTQPGNLNGSGNGMRINPNPSVLETYVPGKLAQPGTGTGTINRSPDGGTAGPNSTGNVASGTQPGGVNPPPAGPAGLVGAQPVGNPALAPGLHLQVTDGAIVVTNNGGSLGFQAGQFGFVPNVNQPPVIVPSNPGIQFVPPPSFNSGSGGPTASNGPGQGQATDCIVR
jgi:hypothetical protein